MLFYLGLLLVDLDFLENQQILKDLSKMKVALINCYSKCLSYFHYTRFIYKTILFNLLIMELNYCIIPNF